MITADIKEINSRIELLPEHVIDQIKAGEVLERPASLIKELVENSIDANATEINIQIMDNGLELISIEDNGNGISFENLPYAFLRHATSKLKTFDDLYRLHSFGFRGEALASIAASSRVTCQTQPADLSQNGGKIIINGGIEELLVPMKNSKKGTSFFIKNLFFNTPVRLKFIKSKNSERLQLKKMLTSFLLSHPEITFTIKWDDKEKEVYKRIENNLLLKRFEQIVFPKTKEQNSLQKTMHGYAEYEGHSVETFLTIDASKNSPNKHQFLFANDRLFFDKNLHQATIRHFEKFWKFGESGHYVIIIKTPPSEIDVNVHPNKTQIKFSRNDIVHSLLATSIGSSIREYQNSLSHIDRDSSLQSNDNRSFETQESFISIEEERRYSLEDLKNKTFSSKPSNPLSFQDLSDKRDEENQFDKNPHSILELDSQFFIFKHENYFFLASKKILAAELIKKNCLECINHEELISPLLISEPFKVNERIDKHFGDLKKLGYEFDRINQEVIVLRTIPKNAKRALIKFSANTLIQFFLEKAPKNLDLIHFRDFILNSKLDFPIIETDILFQAYQESFIELIALCKKLDANKLSDIFSE
jgi:DNA mismatch repair protein MutL